MREQLESPITFTYLQAMAQGKSVRTVDKIIKPSSRVDYELNVGILWYLVAGQCVIVRSTYEGKDILLGRFAKPPQLITVAPMILSCLGQHTQSVSTSAVQFITRDQAASLHGFYFQDIVYALHRQQASAQLLTQFYLYLAGQIDSQLAIATENVKSHVFEGKHQRLARVLLEHADPDGTVRLTHYDLALILDTYREVVTELLTDFRRAEIIQTGREKIRLLHLEKLQQVIAGEDVVLSRKERLKLESQPFLQGADD